MTLATDRRSMSPTARRAADAYLLTVARGLAAVHPTYVIGECSLAGCHLRAEHGAHVLPACEGNAWIGSTIPTCPSHNAAAEGDAATVALLPFLAECADLVSRLSPADRDAMSVEWKAAKNAADRRAAHAAFIIG